MTESNETSSVKPILTVGDFCAVVDDMRRNVSALNLRLLKLGKRCDERHAIDPADGWEFFHISDGLNRSVEPTVQIKEALGKVIRDRERIASVARVVAAQPPAKRKVATMKPLVKQKDEAPARDTPSPSLEPEVAAPSRQPEKATSSQRRCTVALYRWFNAEGQLLYVGISNDPIRRTDQHMADKDWMRDAIGSTLEWFPSRRSAFKAEKEAIRAEKPLHNIAYADRPPAAAPRPVSRQTSRPRFSRRTLARVALVVGTAGFVNSVMATVLVLTRI